MTIKTVDKPNERYRNAYVLLAFNGYELVEVYEITLDKVNMDPSRVRVFMVDDYLYFTNDTEMQVYNTNISE